MGNPAINANNDLAFKATLTTGLGGVSRDDNSGIWADDSAGIRQLIARTGGAAPGTDAKFLTFSDPVYNNNEAVAFRGRLEAAAGAAAAATAAGIWATDGSPNSLALVARQGSQAPGCPTGATFDAFTSLGLSDSGGAILLATLNNNAAAGVASSNNIGIWEGGAEADLSLILRLGDTVAGKTITKLTFSAGGGLCEGPKRGGSP